MFQTWHGVDQWIVSLGVGLLIGVVSERREAEPYSIAGVRTHTLVALLGCTAWTLGPQVFLGALLLAGALVVVAYWHSAGHDPGLTSEVVLLFSMTLGALAHEDAPLAAALGVVCALLVHSKGWMQRWSRELLREHELRDGLLLAAAGLVVMPLLPLQPVDPWGVLRLTTLWRVVILVMAVGMLGHVLTRALGERWGLPVRVLFHPRQRSQPSGSVSGLISTSWLLPLPRPCSRNWPHFACSRPCLAQPPCRCCWP